MATFLLLGFRPVKTKYSAHIATGYTPPSNAASACGFVTPLYATQTNALSSPKRLR
jgi:hypothetical protein